MRLIFKILICVACCTGLGLLSGLSTTNEITGWYATINKPSWNPPNWIFGPVWTTLYILMGIAVALVWHSTSSLKRQGLVLFVIQFMLNLAWSYLFFNKHLIGVAFAELMVMLILILVTTIVFFKINKTAGLLMLPYLVWVSFATVLNGTVYALNS